MNCQTATENLVGYIKKELDPKATQELEEHLAQCPACREELAKANRILGWVDAASSDSAVRKVSDIVATSLASKASDIHLDPTPDGGLKVRMRIDGALHELATISNLEREGILARIKMLASIEVANETSAQTGRWRTEIGGKGYDFRVAVVPYVLGEGIVLRILDTSTVSFGLDRLNMTSEQLATVQKWIKSPNGLVIVSGPIGSGKTTNAYSMIESIAESQVKVVSVEDPVEYLLKDISQVQVNRNQGLTPAEAIRLLLRSDPDVLYIADITDSDTLEMVYCAAATGHLCIANMNGNSPFDVINRLLGFGLDSHMLAQVLRGISSQRLVRKACMNCSVPVTEGDGFVNSITGRFFSLTTKEVETRTILATPGCEECRRTGYRGRTAIYEMLDWSSALGEALAGQTNADRVREVAYSTGFEDLKAHAKEMVLQGVTSLNEAFRVVSNSF